MMVIFRSRKFVISVIAIMELALLSCSCRSPSREEALYVAACDGRLSETRILLSLGANVNATDVRGYSALMVAEACTALPGRAELVELLITKGAMVNHQARDGRTALMYAAKNGDTQAVKALLQDGASVNIADNEGQTAVIEAVTFACDEDSIRALVEAGADLKATNHKGQGALSSTCLKGTRLGELLSPVKR